MGFYLVFQSQFWGILLEVLAWKSLNSIHVGIVLFKYEIEKMSLRKQAVVFKGFCFGNTAVKN